MKKFLICIPLIMLLALFPENISLANASNTLSSTENYSVVPRKDDIRYVYQIKNGKLYKRLYNFSKDEYIGDWILCN